MPGSEVPQSGKAKRHVLPNERQCWPLWYKPGKGNWRIYKVYLDHESCEKGEEELREMYDEWDIEIITRHGSYASPTELVGGEHVVRE